MYPPCVGRARGPRDWLDTQRGSQGSRPVADSRAQGHFRGPVTQDVALRGVMQALVRIQTYMLADIVVAIPAVDLAVEAVVRAAARV